MSSTAQMDPAEVPGLIIAAVRPSQDSATRLGHGRSAQNILWQTRHANARTGVFNIELAREVVADGKHGELFTFPMNSDDLAFYDAVAQNESAVEVRGEGVLAGIAREIMSVTRQDVRTGWTVCDNVRATLRSFIRRLLVQCDYPPGKQPVANKLVMEQMESMAPRFAEARDV